MHPPEINVLPAWQDNYMYVAHDRHHAVVIDPTEPNALLALASFRALHISHILLTHYDHDHIGGVEAIRNKFGSMVIGPAPSPIHLDDTAHPLRTIPVAGFSFDVIHTPGHAIPHVAYYEKSHGWLFSGDCLFGAGCGRLAGDTAFTMWESLQRLANLPETTEIYFGHEYTLSNLDFALSVEPGNTAIPTRMQQARRLLQGGAFTSPSTLGEELRTNPFLRLQSEEIRRHVGLPDESDPEVFAVLRRLKNDFRG